MREYPGTDFWSWYKMDVPVRRYYAKLCMERIEKQTEASTKPMTQVEKVKMQNKIKKVSNDPSQLSNIFAPMRNGK